MGPEGLLLCTQEPTTGLYPEQTALDFVIIVLSHLRIGLPRGLFPLASGMKLCAHVIRFVYSKFPAHSLVLNT